MSAEKEGALGKDFKEDCVRVLSLNVQLNVAFDS